MARARPLLVTDLDGRRHPGTARPWTWLWSLVGLWVLLDLAIAAVRPDAAEPTLADDGTRARRVLDEAVASEQAWLLLGDSVLAGDVMQGTVPQWSEHRVLDYMRREQAPGEAVGVQQIALDGMLPVDMLHVLERLDALDPGGRVGVVLELNPRYFSKHYARQRECTRQFLCELSPVVEGPASVAWVGPAWQEAHRWLLEHLPVVRHRDLFPRVDAELQQELVIPVELRDQTQGALMGQARVLEHYRQPRTDAGSIQYRALTHVVRRLREHGRPALLFATPLSDRVLEGTLDGDAYGAYVAALDRLVNRPDDSRVRFVSLDHPSLPDELFLDHAHLGPEGNRWLALNLLHQLGVGMASPPPRGTLAYEEGVDRSLVHRIERGSREGAPWQAQLSEPDGIDVSPGGGRVVVADTGNHCVRELVGPRSTVRTLAGTCGTAGGRDGATARAQLAWPRHPVLLGERVYVVDGKKHHRLREVAEAKVRTVRGREGAWSRIDQLRGDGRALWILDRGQRVLRVDPSTGEAQVRYTSAQEDLVAFDVGPDGRLYLGDHHGRIWQLTPGQGEPVLLFANDADELLPQAEGDYFPFDFERMAIDTIADLRYVPRYDGVLVADEHTADRRAKLVTERIHLRFVSFADRKIYPWVHPLVHGGGQMFHNRHTGSLSGYLHLGSMALDPQSATLFYVERFRSRLLQLSDGLLGAAKLGHHITPTTYGGLKDVFGRLAGTSTMLAHHPERWMHRRLEAVPRRGPYLGLMLGSSMTSVTEVVGQYSMGRIMERALARELGLHDGIRFDLVHRAYRGPKLEHIVSGLESFVEHQAPVDVIFIEAHSGRMYSAYQTQGQMAEAVDRLRLAAARYRSLVVVLDNDAMDARKRDGLRGSTEKQAWFLELCERVGFTVVRPSDLLLREAIDHAPWGNAPFTGAHASTWAMDVTADAFARLSLPAVRAHLRDRRPALTRPTATRYALTQTLRSAIDEADPAWAKGAATVPPEVLQVRLDVRTVEVVVDLGRAGVARGTEGAALDDVVRGVIVEALVRDPAGALGNRVVINLVRFDNYDEYGVGVLEGATIVETRSYTTEELAAWLAKQGAR